MNHKTTLKDIHEILRENTAPNIDFPKSIRSIGDMLTDALSKKQQRNNEQSFRMYFPKASQHVISLFSRISLGNYAQWDHNGKNYHLERISKRVTNKRLYGFYVIYDE